MAPLSVPFSVPVGLGTKSAFANSSLSQPRHEGAPFVSLEIAADSQVGSEPRVLKTLGFIASATQEPHAATNLASVVMA